MSIGIDRILRLLSQRGTLWVAALVVSVASPVGPAAAADTAHEGRDVFYSFTLENTTGNLLQGAKFWTYAPVHESGHQSLVGLEVSHPHTVKRDRAGNQVLCFELDAFPPYGTRIITVEAKLVMKSAAAPSHSPGDRYLQADSLIESDHHELQAAANSLPAGGSKTVYEFVKDHVRDTGYVKKDKGALYALQQGEGDCTEYACLFAAMCRARGIPSRVVGGYVSERSAVLRPGRYHNWAEVFEDGAWHIVDPQTGRFKEGGAAYLAMNILTGDGGDMKEFRRFRHEGEGLKVTMNR